MSGELLFIVLILVAAMLAVLIAKLASFLRGFAEKTQYICFELEHASNYNEYRKWRGELRCHYLCLIPFVNRKNVMRLYNRIWHRADKEKKERKDSLVPLLLPSVLGIFICMICVCGMTWAWYTASVETPAQKMTAANYEVTVVSVTNTNGNNEITAENGVYNLTACTDYEVKLTASGSVKECGGYCLIQNTESGAKTYTQTFKPEASITVYFKPDATGKYTFTGIWGSLPTGTENYLTDNAYASAPANNDPIPSDTSESAPTEPTDQPSEPFDGTYTVKKGDTLSAIAGRLKTTVEKLAAYNNIDDPSKIQAGQVLNIPPQDYVIPEPVTSETKPPVTEPATEPTTEPVTDAPIVTEPSDTTSAPADASAPAEPAPAEEE